MTVHAHIIESKGDGFQKALTGVVSETAEKREPCGAYGWALLAEGRVDAKPGSRSIPMCA